jgi:hypothetical protein
MTDKPLTKYDAAAVDKAIAASRQKITRREARLIHALLRGPDRAATVKDVQEAQP